MNDIQQKQNELLAHPVYGTLHSVEGIRHFMSLHVFAVWDFMSLLKSLQREITCVSVPWRPSKYPAEMVRLINQIVLGEESDVDQHGEPVSHFELYLRAMEEVGVSTRGIRNFLKTYDWECVPEGAQEFVRHNLWVAENGSPVEVAASFFFGREKLIPEMFEVIVRTLKQHHLSAPTLLYYLERHIEVDAGEHGPLAMKCLEVLCENEPLKMEEARRAGLLALKMRSKLWDRTLESLPVASVLNHESVRETGPADEIFHRL